MVCLNNPLRAPALVSQTTWNTADRGCRTAKNQQPPGFTAPSHRLITAQLITDMLPEYLNAETVNDCWVVTPRRPTAPRSGGGLRTRGS